MSNSVVGRNPNSVFKDPADGKFKTRISADGTPVEVTFATLTATQKHVNGTVVTAGTPVTVTPPSGNIKAFILQNPPVGPNLNSSTKVLLVSFDGGANYFTVPNGAIYVAEEIDEANITIDATKDNTNFEIILEYA